MFPASAGIPPRGLARLRDGLSVGWQAVSDRVTAAAGACSGKVNQCDRFCARASGQSRWESAVPGSAILTNSFVLRSNNFAVQTCLEKRIITPEF